MAANIPIFDVLLTVTGIRLNSRLSGSRGLANRVSWMIRLVITASSIQAVVRLSMHLLIFPKAFHLKILQKISFHVIGLLMTYRFAFRRKQITRLMRLICCKETRSFVQTYSRFALTFTIGMIIFMTTADLLGSMSRTHDLMTSLSGCLFNLPAWANNYVVVNPFYYILVLRILSRFERRLFSEMMQDASNHRQAIRSLQLMLHARQEFDAVFNVVPFSLFAALFVTIPPAVLYLTYLLNNASSQADMIKLGVCLVANSVIVTGILAIVRQVCRMQTEAAGMARRFIHSMRAASGSMPATMAQDGVICNAGVWPREEGDKRREKERVRQCLPTVRLATVQDLFIFAQRTGIYT